MTGQPPVASAEADIPDHQSAAPPVFALYSPPAGGWDALRATAKAPREQSVELKGVSAPTALAVRAADVTGLTLVGIARADGFEVFTHPVRIT
jgi:FdhD/NarQ family